MMVMLNKSSGVLCGLAVLLLALSPPAAFGQGAEDDLQQLRSLTDQAYGAGQIAEAAGFARRGLLLAERTLGPDHPDMARWLNDLGVLENALGHSAEAEPLLRWALGICERVLGPNHPDTATSLNNLGLLYRDQRRPSEAEPLLRRALEIHERVRGPDHPDTAASLNNLGALYQDQGRYREAELLYQRTLEIHERVRGPDHPDTAQSLYNLSVLYEDQWRYSEAEPLYRRALEIRERMLGPDHPYTASSLNSLGFLYQAQRRYSEAEPLYRRALEIYERVRGPDHPDTASSLSNLGVLYYNQARFSEAEPLFRRASNAVCRWLIANVATVDISPSRLELPQKVFDNHLQTIAALLPTTVEPRPLIEAGFETAQAVRFSGTAQAVARMAARAASGDDALAARMRDLQDKENQFRALDRDFVQTLSRPPQQRDPEREARLRDETGRLRGEIERLNAEIAAAFPSYAALVQPQVLPVAEAQGLLRPDEALLVYVVQGDQSYLWVLRSPDQAALRVLPLGHAALAERVTALRHRLDVGEASRRGHLEPFDLAAAHALYKDILEPAADLLAGADHLIVVPDGTLQSLPFAVLVTEAPQASEVRRFGEYRRVAWLGTQKAISVVPGVSSLQALRRTATRPPGSEPFLGFGEPHLLGDPGPIPTADASGLTASGGLADVESVRALSALPGTGDMLRAIAAALGADPAATVITGDAATVTRVRQSPLERYRVLAFATHGLVAGDVRGLAEPGLVLTPPAVGTAEDDGVLAASEIVQLQLNADWVLLTACNTAAPDGTPGAEGLSGLARAFFYAGARSLLVSHWSVDRDATIALVTELFRQQTPGTGRAAALRAAMRALIAGQPKTEYAHPAYWAPFVIVGEGA